MSDMIALSTISIPSYYDQLIPLLGYWSTEVNIFIFPWGTLTPTLLDVVAILGLPLLVKSVHT